MARGFDVKINRRNLIGGTWWGIVFLAATIGCVKYMIWYIHTRNIGGVLAAIYFGITCAGTGAILVYSIFSKD